MTTSPISRIAQVSSNHPVNQVNNGYQRTIGIDGASLVSSGNNQSHLSDNRDLINAIEKSLVQIGLGTDSQAFSSTQAAGTTSGDGSTNSAISAINGSLNTQAMQTFIQDLFTPVSDDTSGTTDSIPGIGSYSSTLTTGLQGILQALESGSSGSNTSPTALSHDLATLESDFQNLINAMGGNVNTGAQSTSLQEFLQHLLEHLNGQENSATGIGSFISITA